MRDLGATPNGRESARPRARESVPISECKAHEEPTVFAPANMLREARRQKGLPEGSVPRVCILDPDGDIVEHLLETGRATPNPYWACYHTRMYDFTMDGVSYGIVGGAVGASFAVLVAEEAFASGCELMVSVASAGQISPAGPPPYFILIERALRDEGTSYHYMPPTRFSGLHSGLSDLLLDSFENDAVPEVNRGASWTTDAPFRETASEIERHRKAGILTVEMEAAALYAFAEATENPVVCFAHVTNQMASVEGDFEKGADNGSNDALRVIGITAQRWLAAAVDRR